VRWEKLVRGTERNPVVLVLHMGVEWVLVSTRGPRTWGRASKDQGPVPERRNKLYHV